jgi:hypothetical protein
LPQITQIAQIKIKNLRHLRNLRLYLGEGYGEETAEFFGLFYEFEPADAA